LELLQKYVLSPPHSTTRGQSIQGAILTLYTATRGSTSADARCAILRNQIEACLYKQNILQNSLFENVGKSQIKTLWVYSMKKPTAASKALDYSAANN
jgi:hypothetical protein